MLHQIIKKSVSCPSEVHFRLRLSEADMIAELSVGFY